MAASHGAPWPVPSSACFKSLRKFGATYCNVTRRINLIVGSFHTPFVVVDCKARSGINHNVGTEEYNIQVAGDLRSEMLSIRGGRDGHRGLQERKAGELRLGPRNVADES